MWKSILLHLLQTGAVDVSGIALKKGLDMCSLSKLAHKGQLLVDSLFYSLKTVNAIVANELDAQPVSNEFVDYGIVVRNGYYACDSKEFALKIKGDIRRVQLPYKELVDFVGGNAEIKADIAGEAFKLAPYLYERTRQSFDRFNATGKLTSNDATVRIAGFGKKPDAENEYVCKVQPATYYDQVHTNLTLDRLLPGVEECSVRMLDLGPGNTLPSFENSIMANTLGVSAIWVMADYNASTRDKRFKFFLMPRRCKTGIYGGMLSSIGGVAKLPDNMVFEDGSLVSYARSEMKREFIEESGVDYLVDSGALCDADINIVPLAFVRDLNRGGKPQFFFLISTPLISRKSLTAAFRNSFNGNEEFDARTMSRLGKMYLSPETYSNLVYALRWIQRKNNTDFINLG